LVQACAQRLDLTRRRPAPRSSSAILTAYHDDPACGTAGSNTAERFSRLVRLSLPRTLDATSAVGRPSIPCPLDEFTCAPAISYQFFLKIQGDLHIISIDREDRPASPQFFPMYIRVADDRFQLERQHEILAETLAGVRAPLSSNRIQSDQQ